MTAARDHDFGRVSALPLSAVLASIPSYPRAVIERLVARLIDQLDEQDGDPDFDEDDAEDAFAFSLHALRFLSANNGPGCLISDPDLSVDDGREDDPCDRGEPDY
jgi:hypothetical protein